MTTVLDRAVLAVPTTAESDDRYAVTVYVVITGTFTSGGVQETVACASPLVAITLVGVSTDAASTVIGSVGGADTGPVPTAFVALAVKR